MANLMLRSISRQIRDLNVSKVGYTSFYVDGTGGSDDNDGESWDTAFATIQKAIDEYGSWAKIYVKAGTYAENITINKDHIHLRGEDKDTTIISPATGSGLLGEKDDCEIEGLTVKTSEVLMYGVYLTGNSCIIHDCMVGAVLGAYGACVLKGDHCESYRVYPLAGAGVGIYTLGDYAKVHECVVDGCVDGIYIAGSYGKVYENTVLNSTGVGIYALNPSPYNSIYHNNLINNATNALDVDPAGTNDWFENYYDDHVVDTDNDGICDSPYTIAAYGIDYTPVSKRNGWNRVTAGFGKAAAAGAGGISIWESFEYISNAALQAKWIEGGGAGNPTRSTTAYYGQRSMSVAVAGTVGTIHRELASYDMSVLSNLTLATRSSVGGETIAFRLYDSGGYWSEWNLTLAAINTWKWHIISIHSTPDATHATSPVDLADVVKVEMNSLDIGSTFLFDLIEFESLVSSKIGVGYDGLSDAVNETSSVRGHLLLIRDELTDLMNSASGASTLNDANPSDTIVPSSLPTKMHAIFDISNLNNNLDDFTLEVKVGAAASERVVAYYRLTSDGTDITADTGSGIGNKIKVRRIDISGILVYTGEQVLLNYTKNGATDRNVAYKYICGV